MLAWHPMRWPFIVMGYRLSAIVLLPVLLRLPSAQLKVIAWGVVSGVSVGLGWIGFVNALKTVPVTTVGVPAGNAGDINDTRAGDAEPDYADGFAEEGGLEVLSFFD